MLLYKYIYSVASLYLKGTVSQDFLPRFGLTEPLMNRLKQFHKLFRLREDFRLLSSKFACPDCQRQLGNRILALGNPLVSIFQIIAIG